MTIKQRSLWLRQAGCDWRHQLFLFEKICCWPKTASNRATHPGNTCQLELLIFFKHLLMPVHIFVAFVAINIIAIVENVKRLNPKKNAGTCPAFWVSLAQKRPRQTLKKFFSLSVQLSSLGECLAPPFLSDSSKSLSNFRWCSVSLTGVSTVM